MSIESILELEKKHKMFDLEIQERISDLYSHYTRPSIICIDKNRQTVFMCHKN